MQHAHMAISKQKQRKARIQTHTGSMTSFPLLQLNTSELNLNKAPKMTTDSQSADGKHSADFFTLSKRCVHLVVTSDTTQISSSVAFQVKGIESLILRSYCWNILCHAVSGKRYHRRF